MKYGNKKRHVRKYCFWPFSVFSLLGPKYLIELIDLIDQFDKISEDDMGKYLNEVGERIKQYDDKDLRRVHID